MSDGVRMTATCRLGYRLETPAPMLLMLAPSDGAQQRIDEQSVETTPYTELVEYRDAAGNRVHRAVPNAGPFTISVKTTAVVAASADDGDAAPFVTVDALPPDAIPFLMPSRYVESDLLGEEAEMKFGARPAGYTQATAIVDHIRANYRYTPGSSPLPISAKEVAGKADAVCRDMAHLGIAYCRALSIPARMVVGFLDGLVPQDIHAWFEVFCGGRWYTCDPTQPNLDGGRIVIAYGRDAADVAINTFFGTGTEADPPAVTVTVEAV